MNKKICSKCIGSGLIKCIPIKCKSCNIGCYKCKSGYTQHLYKECNKCYASGIINTTN